MGAWRGRANNGTQIPSSNKGDSDGGEGGKVVLVVWAWERRGGWDMSWKVWRVWEVKKV